MTTLPIRDFSITLPLLVTLVFGLLVRETHRLPVFQDERFVLLFLILFASAVSDWTKARPPVRKSARSESSSH